MTNSAIRVACLIPSGIGIGYTGPGVFLKRLLTGAGSPVVPIIYAGLRPGHDHDPRFLPHRWMKFTNYSAAEQLKWAFLSFLWLLKDRNNFDIVHFHGTYVFKLVGAFACLLIKKPYVIVPLASKADMAENGKLSGNRVIRPLKRIAVKKAAHGFALGNSITAELIDAGMPPARVTPIANPVSEEYFETGNANRFNLNQIVFIGTLGERKQALLVLDVLADLRAEGLDVKCSFYGPFESPDFAQQFTKKVKSLALDEVVSHVLFSECIDEILLNTASLFLLPSKQEGIPGALVEAMAAGVPCVVTDVGSMGEIIREAGAGRLVPLDRDLIKEACRDLLTEPKIWKSESEKSRVFASNHFSSSAVASKYVRVLKKLV